MKIIFCFVGMLLCSSFVCANTYIRADNSDFYDLGDFYFQDQASNYPNSNYNDQDWQDDSYHYDYINRTSHWGSKVK